MKQKESAMCYFQNSDFPYFSEIGWNIYLLSKLWLKKCILDEEQLVKPHVFHLSKFWNKCEGVHFFFLISKFWKIPTQSGYLPQGYLKMTQRRVPIFFLFFFQNCTFFFFQSFDKYQGVSLCFLFFCLYSLNIEKFP